MNQAIKYFIKLSKPSPFTLIDVGAMGGKAAKWDCLKEALTVIGFEPDDREFQKLTSNLQTKYLNVALAQRKEDLIFYATKETGKSSIFKPNQSFLSKFEKADRMKVVAEEKLNQSKVTTLDQIKQEKLITDVDFIKIDTQGSELAILKGASSLVLKETFGLMIEVEMAPVYEGQPLFEDVGRFLRDQEFELIDLKRYFWKRKNYYDYVGKGQLAFADALYFKNIDAFFKEILTLRNQEEQTSKLARAVLACLVFRMFDWAVCLIDHGYDARLLTQEAHQQARQVISLAAKEGKSPNFPGKIFLYKTLIRICEWIAPPSYQGWSDSDRFIGNARDL